jgi:hypothetical protein
MIIVCSTSWLWIVKNGQVHEGGKVGRSNATPTKFGNVTFITFEMPWVSYRRPIGKMNISLLFCPSVIRGPWSNTKARAWANTYFESVKRSETTAKFARVVFIICSGKREHIEFKSSSLAHQFLQPNFLQWGQRCLLCISNSWFVM